MQLGYANPDRMLADMQPHHLGEWLAYHRINPWGQWRDDLRSGIVASVIANVNRDPKRKPEPFTASDFIPQFERVEPDAPAPDLDEKIMAFFQRRK